MPYKDDKPKDTEIPPFKAGWDYLLLVKFMLPFYSYEYVRKLLLVFVKAFKNITFFSCVVYYFTKRIGIAF